MTFAARIGCRHRNLSRLEKDRDAADRRSADTWTATAERFLVEECDPAADELQTLRGSEAQFEGQVRPRRDDVGEHLSGLSTFEAGQRLRQAFKMHMQGPMALAKSNVRQSGNGDKHLSEHPEHGVDDKAWGDVNDKERGNMIDRAGSFHLDSCVPGNWLLCVHRLLADCGVLSSAFSATSHGCHSQGGGWTLDSEEAGNGGGGRPPKPGKPTKEAAQAQMLEAASKLVEAAGNAGGPMQPQQTDGAQANVLTNDLCKSRTAELSEHFGMSEQGNGSRIQKMTWASRARAILAGDSTKRSTSADDLELMKGELGRLCE